MRRLGVGLLGSAVLVGALSAAPTSAVETPSPSPTADAAEPTNVTPDPTPAPTTRDVSPQAAETTAAQSRPYGPDYEVKVEPNFSRPNGSYMKASDYTLLNDLERLIRGSYLERVDGEWVKRKAADISNNYIYISVSRMENSKRVGRELIKAAKAGVDVYMIHGKASQSKESRALQKSLTSLKHGHFRICAKGKSLACLSTLNGAIMHSKVLLVSETYDRDNKPAYGATWSGSANLGGPSGEYTFNNGWTTYNDKKIFLQMREFFQDMWAERNIGKTYKYDYPRYIAANARRYGFQTGTDEKGEPVNSFYRTPYAYNGMFYSELSNTTYYPTPISASPANGRDPVINLLNRVVPDSTCKIRLQHNRFKYRRIAVAQKLTRLTERGCLVEAISFRDEIKANRTAHCQQYIRICKPILDVFRTSVTRIPAAYAKPHDKTMLVEAKLKSNPWNKEELLPNGENFSKYPDGTFVRVVQAGSAALTGSNLVVSDEITTETTDPSVYKEYLEHWYAIWRSSGARNWSY
ncbi:phospholipase D-like domain-containing protein [Aeromicrobium sp. Leaf289]|uniref:phospholipase D-like domain-containing protein n=1 Tax=Aeromicrobium sp. Leaf289 TaxID=1736324 RepID=UPI0012E2C781|nr:phospholipase D-like domain-containing protein [Aeromicrobium sp. Leaf289]